jgi:hypothetical protein
MESLADVLVQCRAKLLVTAVNWIVGAPLAGVKHRVAFVSKDLERGLIPSDNRGASGVRGEEVCVGEGGACGFIPQ